MKKDQSAGTARIHYTQSKEGCVHLGEPTLIQVREKRIAYVVGIYIPPEIPFENIIGPDSVTNIEKKAYELITARLKQEHKGKEIDEVVMYCLSNKDLTLVIAILGTNAEKEYWENYQDVSEI